MKRKKKQLLNKLRKKRNKIIKLSGKGGKHISENIFKK